MFSLNVSANLKAPHAYGNMTTYGQVFKDSADVVSHFTSKDYIDDGCYRLTHTDNSSGYINFSAIYCSGGRAANRKFTFYSTSEETFCQSSEVVDAIEADLLACSSQDEFTYECSNGEKTYSTSCNSVEPEPEPEPEPPCEIGSPDWPQCAPLPEPCTPDDPDYPACGDNPTPPLKPIPPDDPTSPLDPITPPDSPPTDVTPPKDVIPPESDDDGSNTDLIKSITSMNSDMNEGMAVIKDGMAVLNSAATANNDLLLSQIKQDADIYENNKKLMLDLNSDLTNAIADSGNYVGKAIDGLGDDLLDGLTGLEDGLNGEVGKSGCSKFSCSGNAASCYMAELSWADKCETSEVFGTGGAADGFADELKDWSNSDSRSIDALQTDGGDISDALSHFTSDNGFSFNSGCPAPYRLSIPELNWSHQIDYQPFCDLAGILKYLIVASASLFSIMMIAKHS